MRKKIYGKPLTTPFNPEKIRKGVVKTVNGIAPDENGNVRIPVGGSGTTPGADNEEMGSGTGTGLTDAEKTLMLALLKNTAYTSPDMADTLNQLESLWSASEDDSSSGSGSGSGTTPGEDNEEMGGTTYTVTNNLTGVTNSNSAATASSYYSATLTAEDGYTMDVTITMGGVDVTDSVYTEDGVGSILITEVTGDIVITATAVLESLPVLYQLAGTPKSVSGLNEDTGIAFGASDANGYTKALTICFAYTGFDASETLLKMSAGDALSVNTNGAGSDEKIRVTCCSNALEVHPECSANNDYRCVITKDALSKKTLNIHYLADGVVTTVSNTGTYGDFANSACAGNLLIGDSDITVNDFTVYEGVMEAAAIAAYLNGGEI